MIIESRVSDKIVYLYPKGRLDFTLFMAFEKAIGQIIKDNPDKHVLLNMKELEYLNSSSLRVITILAQNLRKNNLRLYACGLSGIVKRVLEITNVIEIMDIVKTEEEALQHVQQNI